MTRIPQNPPLSAEDSARSALRQTQLRQRNQFLRHATRIVFRTVVMAWLVATITFVVIRALPGNPIDLFVQNLQAAGLTLEEARSRATATLRYNIDGPLWQQYLAYTVNLLQGDLGVSSILSPGTPVLPMIVGRLPFTLFSVGTALIISFILGVRLGLIAAVNRGSALDHTISNVSAVVDSIPAVLLAVLAVLLLGVVWQIVPIGTMRGAYSSDVEVGFNIAFLQSLVSHALIPGSVYILSSLGGWVLAMRSNAVSALSDESVQVARARGLSESRIRDAYIGRNALLPLVIGFAIALGFVVSGSVLIEKVFVTPGVGQLLADAIARRDYPVMQGVVLVTTLTVLVATACADALAGWLDPRIRDGAAT